MFNKFKLFENQNEVENAKSRNLMPFFHIWLLKSRKQNPEKYRLTKIVKLRTRKIINTNKAIEG